MKYFSLIALIMQIINGGNMNLVGNTEVSQRDTLSDVVIVGSGIGGLTCGALLAKSGRKVVVLEQQDLIGGFCTSYKRHGFTFPVGAHDISGCDYGEIATILKILDLKKEDFFALHTRTYILKNKKITFTGTNDDLVCKLSELFPEEKKNIESFFKEAKEAFFEKQASYRDSSKPCPIFEAWERCSYQEKLNHHFQSQELKSFLCSLVEYIGISAEKIRASHALYGVLSYFIFGGYYPKQGGKCFATGLQKYIESHGGKVLIKRRVDQIFVHNNAVTGVQSGNEKFMSSTVIANLNAKTLLKLLPADALPKSFHEDVQSLKILGSHAVVHLGLDLDLSQYSSIVQVLADPKFSCFINSQADPSTAPKGASSLSIGVHSQYNEIPNIGTKEYAQYKEKLAETAIHKLENMIPNIREHIVVQDVVTPKTFERYTSMPEGAWSFALSVDGKRPHFITPIQGLYLAGASTFPGPGVEAVAASGMLCAREILAKEQ